jgi:hypothetical protein
LELLLQAYQNIAVKDTVQAGKRRGCGSDQIKIGEVDHLPNIIVHCIAFTMVGEITL